MWVCCRLFMLSTFFSTRLKLLYYNIFIWGHHLWIESLFFPIEKLDDMTDMMRTLSYYLSISTGSLGSLSSTIGLYLVLQCTDSTGVTERDILRVHSHLWVVQLYCIMLTCSRVMGVLEQDYLATEVHVFSKLQCFHPPFPRLRLKNCPSMARRTAFKPPLPEVPAGGTHPRTHRLAWLSRDLSMLV